MSHIWYSFEIWWVPMLIGAAAIICGLSYSAPLWFLMVAPLLFGITIGAFIMGAIFGYVMENSL